MNIVKEFLSGHFVSCSLLTVNCFRHPLQLLNEVKMNQLLRSMTQKRLSQDQLELLSALYWLALDECIAKIAQLSQIWNENLKSWNDNIICSIILFITWSFSFLNAICILKVPVHYINRKMQYSTAHTGVLWRNWDQDTANYSTAITPGLILTLRTNVRNVRHHIPQSTYSSVQETLPVRDLWTEPVETARFLHLEHKDDDTGWVGDSTSYSVDFVYDLCFLLCYNTCLVS